MIEAVTSRSIGGKCRARVIVFLAVMSFCALRSFADFTLVDDFSTYVPGALNEVTTGGEWVSPGYFPPAPPFPSPSFAYNVVGVDGAHALGSYGFYYNSPGVHRSLPQAVDGEATFFFRFKPVPGLGASSPDAGLDQTFGLAVEGLPESYPWGNYAAQFGILDAADDPDDAYFQIRVASGRGESLQLLSTERMLRLPRNQWYNAWLVLDTETDTFDLYLNQGDGGALPSDLLISDAQFRNISAPITSILAIANYSTAAEGLNGNFTSIYMDYAGVNLANPMAVPEPATEALLSASAIGAWLLWRFRRRTDFA